MAVQQWSEIYLKISTRVQIFSFTMGDSLARAFTCLSVYCIKPTHTAETACCVVSMKNVHMNCYQLHINQTFDLCLSILTSSKFVCQKSSLGVWHERMVPLCPPSSVSAALLPLPLTYGVNILSNTHTLIQI